MSVSTTPLQALLLAGSALTLLAGCESSQDKAAKLATTSAKVGSNASGSSKHSSGKGGVKVASADLIRSSQGAAIAVQLRNDGSQNQSLVPISVTVRGANGAEVYSNRGSQGGLSLKRIANVPPGGTAWWVASGIRPQGVAKSVRATVDRSHVKSTGVSLDVSDLRVAPDPRSGLDAVGEVVNKTGGDVTDVVVAAVATKGRRVVAAGSASIGSVPAGGKTSFRIKLTGDPSGGVLVATAASSGGSGN
jgi:hypothetical protein